MVKQRVADLQNLLKEKNLSALIIPTNDFHMSEYVGEYFKARKHFSGFTGSAGVMVVTQTEANLWTDGRYFIQAEKQLSGTGVILRKMGEPGVPTVKEYVVENVPQGGKLAFDGRVIPVEGSTFVATPILINACRIISAVTPAARYAPKESEASIAIFMPKNAKAT